ncbi:MAG: YeeE/YedE thiosulfate transporter family protein [Angelakisella sp.]|nr:YeeE/YedE thiosulfate transporter family protein [Angelakisella sp.]
MNIILAILLGGLFGFALYFVGASFPKKLISMLKLEDLTLMKMILFAIGLSSVLLFAANAIGIFDISHLSVKATNLGVLVGGLIFGFGFGWIGSCPGTCVAASSGGGWKKAVITVIGGLVGAFAFSMTYGFWKSAGLFSTMDWGKLTLFNISEKYPALMNIGFWGLLITGLAFMGIAWVLPHQFRKQK